MAYKRPKNPTTLVNPDAEGYQPTVGDRVDGPWVHTMSPRIFGCGGGWIWHLGRKFYVLRTGDGVDTWWEIRELGRLPSRDEIQEKG